LTVQGNDTETVTGKVWRKDQCRDDGSCIGQQKDSGGYFGRPLLNRMSSDSGNGGNYFSNLSEDFSRAAKGDGDDNKYQLQQPWQ